MQQNGEPQSSKQNGRKTVAKGVAEKVTAN